MSSWQRSTSAPHPAVAPNVVLAGIRLGGTRILRHSRSPGSASVGTHPRHWPGCAIEWYCSVWRVGGATEAPWTHWAGVVGMHQRRTRSGGGGGFMAQWIGCRRSDGPPVVRRHIALACLSASVIVLSLPIAQQSAVAAGAYGPTAAIQASPNNGAAPLVVNFNGAQSYGNTGTIASWDVSFGDGTTDASGTGSPPATIGHTYTTPGSYTAGLTVTNRRLSTALATTVVTVTAPGTPTGGRARAVHISVTGGPLNMVTTSPVKLTPRFRQADTDYVWYCANGTNSLTLSLSSSRTISAGGQTGTSVSVSTSVVNNQAVVLDVGAVSYWIRCLPSTFPHISTTRTGTAIPGYYVTGTFKDSPHGIPGYPIILDQYGTPVWYQTGLPFSGDNVELLPGTHTVAWSNRGPYSLYSLDTQSVAWVAPPTPPPDEHELFTDAGGNQWMISVPVRTGYDLSAIGYPTNHNIVDCVVQELNAQGQPVWSWDASQHVSPLEANTLRYLTTDQGVPAVDVYHCNSMDVDPANPDLVLISIARVRRVPRREGDRVDHLEDGRHVGRTDGPRTSTDHCRRSRRGDPGPARRAVPAERRDFDIRRSHRPGRGGPGH